MRFKTVSVPVVLFVLMTFSLSAASWLHVRVDTEDAEEIKVNVPLGLVSTILPMIEEKAFENEHLSHHGIRLDDHHLSVEELREIWKAIKAEGTYEMANIQSKDNDVRIFLDDSELRIQASESSREQIDVRVPVDVVDALLSGTGEHLNLTAAFEVLTNSGERQLVQVDSPDARVRVWIDNSSSGN